MPSNPDILEIYSFDDMGSAPNPVRWFYDNGPAPLWISGVEYTSNGTAFVQSAGGSAGGVLAPNGAAFLGTSITAGLSSGATPQSVRSQSNCWATWLLVALKQPFSTVITKGISGNKSPDMAARYDADIGANHSLIGTLFFEPGPNDFSDDTLLIATIISSYTSIITKARSAGINVVALSPTPSESITPLGVVKRQQAKQALLDLCRQNNCIYINTDEVLSDPATGLPLSALYLPTSIESTRVHLSTSGGQLLGGYAANLVSSAFTKYFLPGGVKRNPKEYIPNPKLTGDNATTVNFFKTGTGVTGTGPDSVAVGVSKDPLGTGAFSSVVCSKGALTGAEALPIAPLIITATGATANQAEILARFGSNYDGTSGTTQQGFWDGNTNWAATTNYVVGQHFQNSLFPGGVWTCIKGGISGATKPAPVSADNYGETKVDGAAEWMWQQTPSAGEQYVAEIEYEITSLTGSVNLAANFLMCRSNSTAPETWGVADMPYYDNTTGNPGTGYPGSYVPKKGVLRSLPVTLVNPGVGLRYIQVDLRAAFMSGSSATIKILSASIVRVA